MQGSSNDGSIIQDQILEHQAKLINEMKFYISQLNNKYDIFKSTNISKDEKLTILNERVDPQLLVSYKNICNLQKIVSGILNGPETIDIPLDSEKSPLETNHLIDSPLVNGNTHDDDDDDIISDSEGLLTYDYEDETFECEVDESRYFVTPGWICFNITWKTILITVSYLKIATIIVGEL